MELRFLGAATTVTGSQFLLTTKRAKVLIDCGIFQGSPHEVEHNRTPPVYDPSEIDALLLTHAHLDHCGLIPLIHRLGMRAPIFATAGTVELAELVLMDSAKLQEEFAKRDQRQARNRREVADDEEALLRGGAATANTSAEPLYTVADVRSVMRFFHAVGYEREIDVAPGVRATLYDAGHILGSAMIRVVASDGDGTPDRVIVFSGDIGRPSTPIVRDPTPLSDVNYVVMESTYGGREHDPQDEAVRLLAEAVQLVAQAKGVLLVPSFAIGRTQEVVYELDRLVDTGRIPKLRLFLDSPMASKATQIYRRHAEYFDEETKALLAKRDDPLDYPDQVITNDTDDSRKIRASPRPYMIVASNGMLTGGRVLNHLRELVDDPSATLLFVGYQGQGTLGAHLQAGAKEVTIDGQVREVRCRVRSISGFSAHADESELLAWIAGFKAGPRVPRTVFIVHGDPPSQAAHEARVRELGFATKIPAWRESVTL